MFVRAAANQLMTQLLHFAWREKTATAHDFKMSRWIWQLQSLDTVFFLHSFALQTSFSFIFLLVCFPTAVLPHICQHSHRTRSLNGSDKQVLFFQRCLYFISSAQTTFMGDSLPSTHAVWDAFFPSCFWSLLSQL